MEPGAKNFDISVTFCVSVCLSSFIMFLFPFFSAFSHKSAHMTLNFCYFFGFTNFIIEKCVIS